MGLVVTPKNCDDSVKKAIQQIARKLEHVDFYSFTASRLIATDSNQEFASVANLTTWVGGTVNRITVADDGDGTLTLDTPQDTHVDATPEFAGITIKDSSDNIIFYVDDDEMYFTGGAVAIADGMCIGLLLALTYKT